MILGYMGVVLGLVGVVATWNLGLGPRWYPVALVVLAIPQCWSAGRSTRRSQAGAEGAWTSSPRTARAVPAILGPVLARSIEPLSAAFFARKIT